MKKFLRKTSIFVMYVLAVQIVFPVLVDPFNVFHFKDIRATGTEPNRNYIKMRYLLDNPGKYDGFLFGSSRVGAIHTDKITDKKIYNLTYSVGLPAEHLANLQTFRENGIIPQRVYIGVDGIPLSTHIEDHVKQAMRCPYEYLKDDSDHFFSLYFNPLDAMQSLAIPVRQEDISSIAHIYTWGHQYEYNAISTFDWDNVKYETVQPPQDYHQNISRALNDMNGLADFCRENNIGLIIFTNPMYCVTHMNAVDIGYLQFLEGLAEISDFWNFSSLNDVTLNKDNYRETSHYKAEVGDMIIDAICNGKSYPKLQAQGFGVKVTRENVKDLIAILRQQAEDLRQNNKNSPAP